MSALFLQALDQARGTRTRENVNQMSPVSDTSSRKDGSNENRKATRHMDAKHVPLAMVNLLKHPQT